MAKDPAFLFYPNDYIGGTMGWSFEEKGAYIELLMMQFNRGHMTEHMVRHTVGQLWDTIKVKFKKDKEGLYFNKRLEDEKIKRSLYTASRRNNADGKNQYSKEGHTTKHMDGHMEDENINENKDTNKRFKEPPLDEVKVYCKFRNNNVDPDIFWNFYESKGWMVGKNRMKSWKAAVHTWEKNDDKTPVNKRAAEEYKHFDEK